MDRAIDPVFASAQKRRRIAVGVLVLAGVLAAFSYGPSLLRPSVPRSRVRIEKVDRGPVEASITANGTVTPDLEEVIASPVDARVTRILKRAGDAIKAGEPILELDLSEPTLARDRLDHDVDLKRNEQRRTRLDLQSRLADLDAATEAKRLEVEALQARLAQQTQLADAGLVSGDGLREARLNEARAALELKRLIASRAINEEMTKAQIDGLDLDLATLEAQRREARRVLDLGSTRAERDSVVTWTVTEAGALVRRGEPLARLSDLKSFRIEATVSAIHGRSLKAGLDAVVRIGAVDLTGTVSTVEPTVRDGVMRLWVRLALTATQPAKIFGLYPGKGSLSIGADADIVLFDPGRAVTISHTNLHHRVDYTPYEGRQVTGWPVTTILRGEVLVRDGVLREDASRGRFLRRSAS